MFGIKKNKIVTEKKQKITVAPSPFNQVKLALAIWCSVILLLWAVLALSHVEQGIRVGILLCVSLFAMGHLLKKTRAVLRCERERHGQI